MEFFKYSLQFFDIKIKYKNNSERARSDEECRKNDLKSVEVTKKPLGLSRMFMGRVVLDEKGADYTRWNDGNEWTHYDIVKDGQTAS